MKKRKGVALIMVVGVFTLIFMFITIMTTFTMQNALAARKQEERVRAYYLVQAGMEIGRYAVTYPIGLKDVLDDEGLETGEQVEITILSEAAEDPRIVSDYSDYNAEKGILFPSGIVDIRLTATDEEGNDWFGPDRVGDEVWVEIYSVGTIVNGSGQETRHAGKLRICADNPAKTIRVLDNPLDF